MSTKIINVDAKVRSILDDMTTDELSLFEGDIDSWGDAEDAVKRGCLYLDRVMPDWYERVSINELSLASGCSCVLGQIFVNDAMLVRQAYAAQEWGLAEFVAVSGEKLHSDITDNGFIFGIHTLGLKTNSEGAKDSDGDKYNAATFFGFDHSTNYSYSDLQGEWVTAIADRKEAACR